MSTFNFSKVIMTTFIYLMLTTCSSAFAQQKIIKNNALAGKWKLISYSVTRNNKVTCSTTTYRELHEFKRDGSFVHKRTGTWPGSYDTTTKVTFVGMGNWEITNKQKQLHLHFSRSGYSGDTPPMAEDNSDSFFKIIKYTQTTLCLETLPYGIDNAAINEVFRKTR